MENNEIIISVMLWDVWQYLKRFLSENVYTDFIRSYKDGFDFLENRGKTLFQEARSLAFGKDIAVDTDIVFNPHVLKTIFSSIMLHGNNVEDKYWPIHTLYHETELLKENVFNEAALTIHLGAFLKEWDILKNKESGFKPDTLLSLVEKYFWCIPPWGIDGKTDVPLFSLAKMTSAIISCWMDEQNILQDPPNREVAIYSLVCGDFSGIQKYLYRISSSKGAAKGLKARSFELAITSDAVAKTLLQRFHLITANLIYSSGGKFYILAPIQAKTDLERRDSESFYYDLEKRCWEFFKGDLYLGLGVVSLTGDDFLAPHFGNKWNEVLNRCNDSKKSKYRSLMQNEYQTIFSPKGKGGLAVVCDVCQQEEDDDHKIKAENIPETGEMLRSICQNCEKMEKIGRALANTNIMVEVKRKEIDNNNFSAQSINPFGLENTYYLWNSLDEYKINNAETTFINLNIDQYLGENFITRQLSDAMIDNAFRFYGGNYIPRHPNGEPLNYEEIANESQGVKRLGVLRMDVDFLGEIFQKGLGSFNSAARVLTLSWHMNYFFSGRLNRIAGKFSKILIVYSGGDDLFVVGPWDQVVEMAQEIRADFLKYTGNSFMTISGGMVVVPQKFPIHKSAILSGEMESSAKKIAQNKNGFCFLDKPVTWHDFEIVTSMKDALYQALTLEEKPMDKGILTRLRQIYLLYMRQKNELANKHKITIPELLQEVQYGKWRWRLVYSLSRFKRHHKEHEKLIDNIQQALIKNEWHCCNWIEGEWSIAEEILIPSENRNMIDFLDIPVRWVELLLRKETESE